jgi:exo-beta-1,3-glucanase (GH17 family)
VASFLVHKSISKVRIFDNDEAVIQAFGGTGIEMVIGIPNGDLPDFQTEAQADQWVSSYLAPLAASTTITAIAVGSEVVTNDYSSSALVLPAMKNLHTGLTKSGLSASISVTTANSMAILQDSFPPSAARFNTTFAATFMKPLLDFLRSVGSFVMINAYPYLAYSSDPATVPLGYALFQGQPPVVDPNTTLQYTSLFDAQLDALYFAMEGLGHSELKVVVSETGWPTKGDADESGASLQNAKAYNSYLVARVVQDVGTPHRPNQPVDAYIFSLYNENLKTGAESERHWGVFNPDGTSIYPLDLTGTNTSLAPPSAPQSNPTPATTPTPSANATNGATWCVAKAGASNSSLSAGINWACGQGKANCSAIQQGQACYLPNTFQNHASYAYNSYFFLTAGNKASCDFNATATITSTNPSESP